nr:MAG TPA: hypothetical protein [Caudoviricetes sp.]
MRSYISPLISINIFLPLYKLTLLDFIKILIIVLDVSSSIIAFGCHINSSFFLNIHRFNQCFNISVLAYRVNISIVTWYKSKLRLVPL